jgi:hypothetical protein
MDKREYWSTRSPLPEYHSIVFEHPSFDAPVRLVANQFAAVTLGGQVHTPCGMVIKPPDLRSDGNPSLSIAFPRQVVGRQFKQQLKLIEAAGSRAPIEVTYSVYLGAVDVPEIVWNLYAADAGGITFSADQVQVKATLDNPMRGAVATIYTPDVFTGLQSV